MPVPTPVPSAGSQPATLRAGLAPRTGPTAIRAGRDSLAARGGDDVAVRAIRGATQLEADERDHLLDSVDELIRAILEQNDLDHA